MKHHIRAVSLLRVWVSAFFVLLCLAAGSVSSWAAETVTSIQVDGTQRIDPQTVISYLLVDVGDDVNPDLLDKSLKRLFATGYFADVALRVEDGQLLVKVVENPIINRISFEGNRKVKDDDLYAEVTLQPRVVYTRTKVQADTDRLIEIYRRNGRYSARIEPKLVELPQNRVDLIFEIDEGPESKIRRINFIGNRVYSDGDLRDELQSEETAWWKFLTNDDTYDPDRVAYDRELLRRFYLSRGYADFRVISTVAELTADREDFFLTFTVDEGERYTFGDVEIETEFEDLDKAVLMGAISIESGKTYNAIEIEKTIEDLTDLLGTLQYAFVDIRPMVNRNPDDLTIDLVFNISEGPRVFVERIDITGNVRTTDEVIRREMLLAEGDPFNTAYLRRSRQRIQDLGFFSRVDVETQQGDDVDQSVIAIDVTEQSTGELSVAAGFSTTDGALADFRIRERNLLGLGKDLSVASTLSTRSTELDLSYTEPYFLHRNLTAGIDLFHIVRDYQDESSYDQKLTGFGFRLGYPVAEHLSQRLLYKLERTRIEDVSENASRYIREQEGETLASLVGQDLIYDRRNSRLAPSEGYFIKLSNQLAGLGGDVRYIRAVLGGGTYFTVFRDNWRLGVTAEAGYIVGLGEDVRINDRFFIGGDTLRGFEVGGIGPRDTDTDDALGGNRYIRASAEMSVPVGVGSDVGITGHAFMDVGTMGDVDADGPEVADEESLRLSVGVGFSWRSPLGPLRIDIAKPILKESFDQEEVLRFSFGTQF